MQYRQIGRAGVRVSRLALGSWLTIGSNVPESDARDHVRRAFDGGINFIDTADAYNAGAAEETLGRLLADHPRHTYVLATKVFFPMSDGPNDCGLSRKHIIESCHASLRRLRTEYVDLYQCHRADPDVPLEETLRALDDLVRQGKILYWGVSEWPAELIVEAHRLCDRLGLTPPISNQPSYNLLWRYPERDVFPVGHAFGMGHVTFSGLANGVLTGKYKPGQPPPEGTRAATDSASIILRRLYWGEETLRRVQEMAALAGELGVPPARLALAWVLANPAVTAAILGISKTSQLEENLKAVDLTLDDATLQRLDQLFPRPLNPPNKEV